MLKTLLPAVAALVLVASPASAQGIASALDFPQPAGGAEFYALIEIPAGSFTKYEADPATGRMIVDRFQSMPVAYPANYGFVPSSLAGDGDPLDVLVFTREPIIPGALILVRAIGVLRMIDGGEEDDKVIAVPASDVDPTYDLIQDLADLPPIERQRVEAFFRVYKDLPEGRKVVELRGFAGAEQARQEVARAIELGR